MSLRCGHWEGLGKVASATQGTREGEGWMKEGTVKSVNNPRGTMIRTRVRDWEGREKRKKDGLSMKPGQWQNGL